MIDGTSSVQHLRENLSAANLELPIDKIAVLNQIAAGVLPTEYS